MRTRSHVWQRIKHDELGIGHLNRAISYKYAHSRLQLILEEVPKPPHQVPTVEEDPAQRIVATQRGVVVEGCQPLDPPPS